MPKCPPSGECMIVLDLSMPSTTLLSNLLPFPYYSRSLPPPFSSHMCRGSFLGNFISISFSLSSFLKRRSKLFSFFQVCFWLKMSTVVDAMSQHLNFPEILEKLVFNSRPQETGENRSVGSLPVDILDAPKEYIFYMDIPGLSKSDVQVTIEDENTLVIRSNGKRKREDCEEEGCKYIRLERRPPQKLLRKFRLPDDCNVSAITAKCENGVLTVVVEKLPPPPKPMTVEVAIS